MLDRIRRFKPSYRGDNQHTEQESQQDRRIDLTRQQSIHDQTAAPDDPIPTCNTGGIDFVKCFLSYCYSRWQNDNFRDGGEHRASPQGNIQAERLEGGEPSTPPQTDIQAEQQLGDTLAMLDIRGDSSSQRANSDSNTPRDVSPPRTIPTEIGSNRLEVHRGSSRDTLQGLLKHIIEKVKVNIYQQDISALANIIYDLSVKNDDQTQVPFSITREEYRLALSNIPVPR